MLIAQKILKLLLMIAVAPIVVALTLFVWICLGLVYVSGLVLGLISQRKRLCCCSLHLQEPGQYRSKGKP